MTAEIVWAFLQAQSFLCCATLSLLLLACVFLGWPWMHIGAGDGCSSGCCVLIVLDLLLSTDEFNDPVHFTIDSEGDQVAAAWAAPANAGRVTSAALCKDCCVELTAGTLITALGDLFVTSSRSGLIQNNSTRLDWLALGKLSCEAPNTCPEITCVTELLSQARQSMGLMDCPSLPDSSSSHTRVFRWVSHSYTFSYLFLDVLTKVSCLKLTGFGRLSCNVSWCSFVLVKSYSAVHG